VIWGIVSPMNALSDELITKLTEAAAETRENAHAPYSGYRVGAAVVDERGRIFSGCNVENASYGLSVCAERHALAAAVAAGAQGIRALLVLTRSNPPASPCGACRQVMREFGDFPVVMANTEGARIISSVEELLPMAFGPDSL